MRGVSGRGQSQGRGRCAALRSSRVTSAVTLSRASARRRTVYSGMYPTRNEDFEDLRLLALRLLGLRLLGLRHLALRHLRDGAADQPRVERIPAEPAIHAIDRAQGFINFLRRSHVLIEQFLLHDSFHYKFPI